MLVDFVSGDCALLTLENVHFGFALAGQVDRVAQCLAVRRKLPPISLGRLAFELGGKLHGVSIDRLARDGGIFRHSRPFGRVLFAIELELSFHLEVRLLLE